MVEVAVTYEGNLRTLAIHGPSGEKMETDAPKDNGGKGEKFSPTDLVAVALGTCVLTIMGLDAKRQGIDFVGARLLIKKEMQPFPKRMIAKLEIDFFFPSELNAVQQEKLEKAAMNCPVHASLHPSIEQKFNFHWGQP